MYVIITPAYNEATFIEQTIVSVLGQTTLPLLWIIVDDGSTDNTADIIQKYSSKYEFIQYHYREKPDGQAYFASNVFAIMEGYKKTKDIAYNFLAILDADIQLPPYYYEKILNKFELEKNLGIASGVYENLINGNLYKVLHDRRSTPKAIQVFRRNVFEKIGGFLPLESGGEDTIACVMARMEGWQVWSFPNIKVIHLRPTGTGATKNILSVRFKQGICEYDLATHPLFFLLKTIRRALLEKPFLLGGFMRLCGYIYGTIRGNQRVLPPEIINHIRKEQLNRLLTLNKV